MGDLCVGWRVPNAVSHDILSVYKLFIRLSKTHFNNLLGRDKIIFKEWYTELGQDVIYVDKVGDFL